VPEGDTLWRTADRLHRALADAPIILSDLRWGELTGDLRGMRTLEVRSRGKHLLHRLDGGLTVHSHLRMEGQWRVVHPGPQTDAAMRRSDLRAAMGTADWTALGLRLGMLDLIRTRDEGTLVGHLGPDVLGADWDPQEATRRLLARGGLIVDGLLDQRMLAGVGTYWASEGLFIERVLPWTPVADLGPERTSALLDRIHRLMDRAKDHALQSSTGDLRRGYESYVHARSSRPCRRCGDTIRVAMTGEAPQQRTIFSCPTCQGGYAPTDDRQPQAPLGSGLKRGTAYRPRSGA
jgi:endonuclease-8